MGAQKGVGGPILRKGESFNLYSRGGPQLGGSRQGPNGGDLLIWERGWGPPVGLQNWEEGGVKSFQRDSGGFSKPPKICVVPPEEGPPFFFHRGGGGASRVKPAREEPCVPVLGNPRGGTPF